jgi:hypothetical protein
MTTKIKKSILIDNCNVDIEIVRDGFNVYVSDIDLSKLEKDIFIGFDFLCRAKHLDIMIIKTQWEYLEVF